MPSKDGQLLRPETALAVACALTIAAAALFGLPPAASANSPACAARGPVLGVSRTVEIDATGGPRFGQQQYPDHADLLNDGEVVLTFDDGPLRPYTSQVMQALDRHCTKATFFLVGTMALADPQMVRELARRGHTIGTHTWSHGYQLRKTAIGRAQHEIEAGMSGVQRALGAPVAPFFRFPFLSDSRAALQYLAERNIAVFSIDIDALDYRHKGPDGAQAVFQQVMGELAYRKKGILLFHDIQPSTAEALPRILDALRVRGFRVVHLVPKARAETLARFDKMMETEAGRRRLAAASDPLATRSVTWPMAPPGTLAPGAFGSGAAGAGGAASGRQPVAEPRPAEVLPWQVQPPAEPRPAPRRQTEADDGWKRRILGN